MLVLILLIFSNFTYAKDFAIRSQTNAPHVFLNGTNGNVLQNFMLYPEF